MKIYTLLAGLAILLTSSCIMSTKQIVITLSLDKMVCTQNGVIYKNKAHCFNESKFKLGYVIGKHSCTFCKLIQLPLFDEIADTIGRSRINYFTIVQAEDSINDIIQCVNMSYLSFPTFIDTCDVFGFDNKMFKIKEDTFLLLDQNNQLIFQGDLINSSKNRNKVKMIISNR